MSTVINCDVGEKTNVQIKSGTEEVLPTNNITFNKCIMPATESSSF